MTTGTIIIQQMVLVVFFWQNTNFELKVMSKYHFQCLHMYTFKERDLSEKDTFL